MDGIPKKSIPVLHLNFAQKVNNFNGGIFPHGVDV